MDSDDQLFDKIFEFKMMAKQFSKESTKAAAKQKALMGKIKTAIEKKKRYSEKKFNQKMQQNIIPKKVKQVHVSASGGFSIEGA